MGTYLGNKRQKTHFLNILMSLLVDINSIWGFVYIKIIGLGKTCNECKLVGDARLQGFTEKETLTRISTSHRKEERYP